MPGAPNSPQRGHGGPPQRRSLSLTPRARGPRQNLPLAQAFLSLHATDSKLPGDPDSAAAAAAAAAAGGRARSTTSSLETSSSCCPVARTDNSQMPFAAAAAAAAPAAAAEAAADGVPMELERRERGDTAAARSSCRCSQASRLVRFVRKGRLRAHSQLQQQQQQQHWLQDMMLQQLQCGHSKGAVSPPPQQLLDSVRRKQQQLLLPTFPLKGVRVGLLLQRLLLLLLRPRGRGFAAVIDNGLYVSRKQQLLLAAVAAAPHIAKLLLILRPFLLLLLPQQQQQQDPQPAGSAAAYKQHIEVVLGEGSVLLLVLLSLQALGQAVLFFWMKVPFLDFFFVAVGGCLRLASLHALLLTLEALPGGSQGGLAFVRAHAGAPGGLHSLLGPHVAAVALRLLLCLPPLLSLLQLLLPTCSLLCLRSSTSCSCRKRAKAAARQQQQQQQAGKDLAPLEMPAGADDPAVPAGTAAALLLLLCSNMGAPLSLHTLLIGGPLLRSVRLCDQLLQQHFDAALLLLCSRGVTASWAPDRLLLAIHLCYFFFCCCYLLLSCSVRLLQLRKRELLLQLQLLMEPQKTRPKHTRDAAAAAAPAAALRARAAAGPEDNEESLHSRRERAANANAAAAAAAAAATNSSPYVLLSDVSKHLETEGFFSSPGTIWPPC
ncbi:hypothetical protein, conserved [Eimeria tenella]|uniref:Uncharacterized protein n=1 Tax=Eimeria tenella TaxID=5802 RepID=U6L9V6_EIMTE|nr:hypothetical protein, conserved [Eimeria tenella]CDJ44550.1 hypothetical protein, conserved [Eimeria tenella]|eukprot:XP_013235298.1 hypothetical protein, conserved [Eimeria tenella]